MANPIGEAFVRVRGDTSTFKESTRTGVTAGIKDLAITAAKTFGLVFGAEKVFDFGKDAIQEAALTQKATESIKHDFGGVSEEVLHFGETAASSFAIGKTASYDFAAQVGLTGKNIGLSTKQSADMAVGFQKLAGTVGLIKGVDPATYFDKLKLAMLGNTRGLKQLGISFTSAQQKDEALRLGITKQSSDWTAADKAQIIYGLSMSRLPGLLDEASKHSGDAADAQLRLQAEFSNVKEEIGAALLPAFQSIVVFLAGNLPGAISGAISVIKTFTGIIPTDVIKGLALGVAAVTAAWLAYTIAQTIAAGALAAFNALFAISPFGLVIIGIVALVATLYVLYNRVQVVHDVVQAVFGFVRSFIPAAIEFVRSSITGGVNAIVSVWNRFSLIRQTVLATMTFVRSLIQASMNIIRGVINVVLGLIHGNWTQVWNGLKQIVTGALQLVTAGVRAFVPLLLSAARALGQAIFNGIKSGMGDIAGFVGGKIRAIPNALGNLSHLLYNAGAQIVQGLIDGITSKIGALTSKVASLASTVTSHFPLSPAKTGPLRAHPPETMGAHVVELLAQGLGSRQDLLARTTAQLAAGLVIDPARVNARRLPAPAGALAASGGLGNPSALLAAISGPSGPTGDNVHIDRIIIQHPDPHRVLQEVLNQVASKRRRR